MVIPGKEHWTVAKRVFRYLRGTTYLAICYHKNYEEVGVHGFIDFDWARDINGRRSRSGCVFRLSSCSIIWMIRK